MSTKLIDVKDPLLHTTCKNFDFAKDNAQELFELLKAKMIEENGIGLAAPQVGIDARVFVLGDPRTPESIIPVFNPRIVMKSDENVLMEEGCLSYPGLFLKIKRPSTVRARFANLQGDVDTANFSGLTARIFLHEYDHLEGIVFVDLVSKIRLDVGERQKKKLDRIRDAVASAK